MEPGHFRHVLGHFPTGVVAAMHDEHGPVGMAVGSFASVSDDPPLVAFLRRRGWSIALAGRAHIAFEPAPAGLSVRAPTEEQQQAGGQPRPGSHDPPELSSERPYRVRNISAPVFDASGAVVMMLALIGLRRYLGLGEIERHRDRLVAATGRITRALGGSRPAEVKGGR